MNNVAAAVPVSSENVELDTALPIVISEFPLAPALLPIPIVVVMLPVLLAPSWIVLLLPPVPIFTVPVVPESSVAELEVVDCKASVVPPVIVSAAPEVCHVDAPKPVMLTAVLPVMVVVPAVALVVLPIFTFVVPATLRLPRLSVWVFPVFTVALSPIVIVFATAVVPTLIVAPVPVCRLIAVAPVPPWMNTALFALLMAPMLITCVALPDVLAMFTVVAFAVDPTAPMLIAAAGLVLPMLIEPLVPVAVPTSKLMLPELPDEALPVRTVNDELFVPAAVCSASAEALCSVRFPVLVLIVLACCKVKLPEPSSTARFVPLPSSPAWKAYGTAVSWIRGDICPSQVMTPLPVVPPISIVSQSGWFQLVRPALAKVVMVPRLTVRYPLTTRTRTSVELGPLL